MNISRRAFASLSLTAPLALLSACGGAQPAPAPEKTFAPYWVSEKVETGGKEFDIKGNLGIAVEDFMVLALYEDGTGQSADMDGGSESFKWSEKDGVISIDGMNEGESLKRDGDKLVFTIDPQGENVVVTFKNVTDMPQQLKGSFDAMKQFAPRFDSAQTMRMSTYMLDGIMTLANDKYYGMYYDTISGNMHQGLGMLDFWMSESANIHTDNLVMLDTDCSPTHVQVSGEYVYYVREDRETEKLSLCRVKADGSSAHEVLVDEAGGDLHVTEKGLLFTDKDHHLVRSDLAGKDVETIVSKECYFSYPIDDEWFIYQDDADSEQLHLFYEPTGFDTVITQGRSMSPVIDGTTLWYTHDHGGYEFHLVKMDLTSWDSEKLAFSSEESDVTFSATIGVDADRLYLGYRAQGTTGSDTRDNWNKLSLGEFSTEMDRSYEAYFSPEYHISYELNAKGLGTGIYCNATGSVVGFKL